MKIFLSKYAGFCDGVKRAYDIVEKISKDKNIKKPVFVLGSLVHNQDVVKKIEEMGIKKLNFDGNIKKFFALHKGKIGTIVITAHGIGPEFYIEAQKRGMGIIDTTCPKVLKVQRLAKHFCEKSYQLVLIGEKKHKEVRGIYEWSGKKAKIIESEKEAENIKFDPKRKIAVISQTTQNEDLVKKIIKKLELRYPKKVESFDTLCDTTHERQGETKKMAERTDAMIIIGSPESANSTHLWKISKKINPKSYFIEKQGDIDEKLLKKCQKVGISAGASTPDWIIREVCSFLKNGL